MEVQGTTARFDEAVSSLCPSLKEQLRPVPRAAKLSAFEIRLRVGNPIALTSPGQVWFVGKNAELHNIPQMGYLVTRGDLADSVVSMCSHSVHSHQNEMRHGFITLRGGHRAGICGTAVLSGSEISAVRDVTSVNLRIAREIMGAATPLIDQVFQDKIRGTLIVGPPSSGKTTLLRDLARQLSNGKTGRYIKVAVVDERGEIGAVYDGVPQNSLGVGCDILSGYPKGEGILTAVRTLSPQVIICDEIGAKDEVDSILDGLNCGVKVIATAHAETLDELYRRGQIQRLLDNGAFERIVVLGSGDPPGQITDILEVGDLGAQGGRNGTYRSMLLDDGRFHGVRVIEKSVRD